MILIKIFRGLIVRFIDGFDGFDGANAGAHDRRLAIVLLIKLCKCFGALCTLEVGLALDAQTELLAV